MLMYTLFTYKEPFADCIQNVKEKIHKINNEDLSKLFAEIRSNCLKELLLDCCKCDPSKRLTFSQLFGNKNTFNETILKELDLSLKLADEIWKEAMQNEKDAKEIEFKEFFQFLLQKFALKENNEQSHYLKQAIRVIYTKKPNDNDPSTMTLDHFRTLCRLFALTEHDEDFIRRIVEVFEAPWFYGCVERTDAENQLTLANKKKTENYFIVRYASSKKLCFTFQMKNLPFDHQNIEFNDAVKSDGYVNFVHAYTKKKGLIHTPITGLPKTFKPFKK